jgi:sec-independent protein translocase protein TatC
MIVIIFVMAAIITPPDVVSQVMVAVPMIGLYELSILLSRLIGNRRKEKEDEEDTDEDEES